MFCVHCGKALPDDAKFCPFCGKSATVQASSTPASPPAHESSSTPVELLNPTLPPEQNAPAPEPDVTSEAEPSPIQETSTPAPETTKKYRVTFMRWDTSGPELTITFSQDDPITIFSGESRTVTLSAGTQHISLDTVSQHSEFEISLDADIKVNLRWDADSGLFSADYSTREPFKFTTTTPAVAPTSPSASTSTTKPLTAPVDSASSTSQKAGKHGIVIGLCIAFALALVLAILAVMIFRPGSNQVTGVWKFDHSIIEGAKMTAADLGTDMYIYLSEDGSAEVTADYGSVEREFGKWELIDSKTLLLTLPSTGEEILFSRSRNTLSAPYDGATMYFTRSSISPSQIPTPNLAVGADNVQEFTEPPTPIPTQPTIEYTLVSVQELYNELNNNALRAQNTYQDMYIVTVGVLGGIDNDGKYFSIHDPYDDSFWTDDLHCNITTDEQLRTLMNLNEGDTVTVHGKITTVGEVLGYYIDLEQLEYGDTTYYYNEDMDDSYAEELDYSWLEGEYEKAHDVDITMVLDVDDLITTEIYVRFLRYNPSGDTEVLGEGPASYVRGGESPRFEGYLYNDTMDPITIEYDENSYNFTIDCSALGFFGDTFTDLF